MVRAATQATNIVGFRIAKEDTTIKTLPGTPVWTPYEPNNFDDFGGSFSLIARTPIESSAQRSKGGIVDLDASGSFTTDVTQNNIQDLCEGAWYAQYIRKGEEAVTAVDVDTTNPDEYEVASTTGFLVNSLIKGSGFSNSANNALNVVTAIVTNTSVEVADGQLTDEASPPSDAKIVVVGYQGTADDIDVDASGDLPALTSTTLDFTTLGLSVGEPIRIGGDTAATRFATAANNGWAVIRSIASNRMEFDWTENTMVTEVSSGSLTVQMFFGRFLKNQNVANSVRTTFQPEFDLGSGDDTYPTNQTILVRGCVIGEMSWSLETAGKVEATFNFTGLDIEIRDGSDSDGGSTGQAPKSGTRPALTTENLLNTANHAAIARLTEHSDTDANPTPLVDYLQSVTLNINNNVTVNKAIGTLGGFDISRGTFQVSADITAYFGSVALQTAIKNNVTATLSYAEVRDNAGYFIYLPVGSLSDGRPAYNQDDAVTVPITFEAARGASVDTNKDFTAAVCWFDYLPTAAEQST